MKFLANFQTTLSGWSVVLHHSSWCFSLIVVLSAGCHSAEHRAEQEAAKALEQAQHSETYAAERTSDGRHKIWFTAPTMGSTYNITYITNTEKNLQPQVDSFLYAFNACLSTYDSSSMLSRWNRSNEGVSSTAPCSTWFSDLIELSLRVHRQSQGAFDPTVGPLLRYWGFFREDPFAGQRKPDSTQIQLLLLDVGLEALVYTTQSPLQRAAPAGPTGSTGQGVVKRNPGVELDFNAIAPGYAADQIAAMLLTHGIADFLVEVGGEVRAAGNNDRGKPWTLAIEKPVEDAREAQILVGVSNAGLATSGNYRKFWERDGVRYSHTLNPQTGFPERSNLLSVSVLAPTAAEADAYATACMVLGLDRGLRLLEQLEEVEGYFIYLDAANTMTVAQTTGFSERTALPQSN